MRNIFLYSPGGCGTRIFYDWLKTKDYNHKNSQSGVHNAKPDNDSKIKSVYLTANPVEIIHSFYKREKYLNNFIRRHSGNLGINTPIPKELKEYVDSGEDLFRLESHFDKYTKIPNSMIILYENMWDNLDEIGSFLNISMHDFPVKKNRSVIEGVNMLEDYKVKLNDTYSNLNEKLSNIKGVKIIK